MKSVEQERETQWDWERESIKCTENSVRFKKYQTTVTAIIFPFQYQCTQFHIYDNASDVCMVGMLKFTFEIFPLNYMDIRAEASFVVSNGLVKFIPSPMITDSIFMTKKNIHTLSGGAERRSSHEIYTHWHKISHRKRSRFSLTTQLIKVNTHRETNISTCMYIHRFRVHKNRRLNKRVVTLFAWQNLTYSIT